MEIKHDKTADAIYIKLSNKLYAYGDDLDDLRRIDYDADGNPRGVELLCVSGGVNLRGLPHVDGVAKVLASHKINSYEIGEYPVDDGVVIIVDLAFSETVGATKPSLDLKKEEVTV